MAQTHPLRKPKARSAIYQDGENILFVPTEDMWLVHDASTPEAVAIRAGLSPHTVTYWRCEYRREAPWLGDWLYGDPPPEVADSGFRPTPAMHAFRQEATRVAILRKASRTPEQLATTSGNPGRGAAVNPGNISQWEEQYRSCPWFKRWLRRGEKPPPEVTIATPEQIQCCRRAWDYVAHCCRVGISPLNSYTTTWYGRSIPDLGWLIWLYGGLPPAGAFVVGRPLQRLRSEMTIETICEKTGVSPHSHRKWIQHPVASKALQDAIKTAGGPGGTGAAKQRKWLTRWGELDGVSMGRMWKYGCAATLTACCERAKVIRPQYFLWLREAKERGVSELLRQYLSCDGLFRTAPRQTGLVAPNFFIASEGMLAFREAAREEAVRQGISRLKPLNKHPCFVKWFVDWTAPRPKGGRRKIVSSAALDTADEPPGGKTGPGTEVTPVAPPRTAPLRQT
jgi:hypothetical protein